jgi:hypothetical protein
MNVLIKNKLITYLVILLLVANCITMGRYWWQQYHNAHPLSSANEPKGASAFLIEKLGFDSVQLNLFRQLQEAHHQAISRVQDSIHLAKNQFFDLLEKDTVSEQALMNGASVAAFQQTQLDRITFDFFKSIQAICKPDQKIIFRQIIREALRIMARPQPPPGGRRLDDPRGQGPSDGPPMDGPPQIPPQGPPQDGPPQNGPPRNEPPR